MQESGGVSMSLVGTPTHASRRGAVHAAHAQSRSSGMVTFIRSAYPISAL